MIYKDKRDQIDYLQQKINAHGKLTEEIKKKIDYKFRLDWNYYSNSMEGNTLTMDETRSVMVGNLTIGGKPIKDVLEMKGHDEVIAEILRLGKAEVRLSETRIREIHKGIMHEEDERKRAKIGVWKTEPNYIINYKNERFDFAHPTEVPSLMHDLLNRTNADIDAIKNKKQNTIHPIDVALQFHLDFAVIHPFYDGNGRTARILTNLLLISFGYPPFWVRTDERNIYNQYLGDIQGYGGSPDLFFDFIANTILRSQNLILSAIEGKDIAETEDLDKEIALLRAELKGEPILTAKASADKILDELEHNIIPLFVLIEEKCEELREFFFDIERIIEYQCEGQVLSNVDSKAKGTLTHLRESAFLNNIKSWNLKLQNISYHYYLKGFTKTASAGSFSINVEINFNDYNYTIHANQFRNKPLEVPYGKGFTNSELQSLVIPIIRELIFDIRQLSENK
jgi:Fic family protein